MDDEVTCTVSLAAVDGAGASVVYATAAEGVVGEVVGVGGATPDVDCEVVGSSIGVCDGVAGYGVGVRGTKVNSVVS